MNSGKTAFLCSSDKNYFRLAYSQDDQQLLKRSCHPVHTKRSLCLHIRRTTGVVDWNRVDDSSMVGIGGDRLSLFHRMQRDDFATGDYFYTHSVGIQIMMMAIESKFQFGIAGHKWFLDSSLVVIVFLNRRQTFHVLTNANHSFEFLSVLRIQFLKVIWCFGQFEVC